MSEPQTKTPRWMAESVPADESARPKWEVDSEPLPTPRESLKIIAEAVEANRNARLHGPYYGMDTEQIKRIANIALYNVTPDQYTADEAALLGRFPRTDEERERLAILKPDKAGSARLMREIGRRRTSMLIENDREGARDLSRLYQQFKDMGVVEQDRWQGTKQMLTGDVQPTPVAQWDKAGEVGFGEGLGKARPPFDVSQIASTGILLAAAKRLKDSDGKPYDKQDADLEIVERAMLAALENEYRGMAVTGYVGYGLSAMPTWMSEFMVTGGGAGAAKEGTKRVATRLFGKAAQRKSVQLAIKALGWTASGTARATQLIPTTVLPETFRRMTPELKGVDTGGNLILGDGEAPATAFMKAYGAAIIESMSEEAGEGITKVGGKLLSKVPGAGPAMRKIAGALKKLVPEGKLADVMTQGGYSNLIGEIGEERLNDLLQNVLGVAPGSDKQDLLGRFQSSIPDGKEMLAEIITLSVPGAVKAGSSLVSPRANVAAQAEQAEPAVESPVTSSEADTAQTTEIPSVPAEAPVEQASEAETPESVYAQSKEAYQRAIDQGIDLADAEEQVAAEKAATTEKVAVEEPTTEAPPAPDTAEPAAWVGARNADIDAERAARGAAPLVTDPVLSNDATWKSAMQRLGEDPMAGIHLVSELQQNRRALNEQEQALLLHRLAEAKHGYYRAAEAQALAQESGDTEAIEQATAAKQTAEAEWEAAEVVNQFAGTTGGRFLQFRQRLLKEDYTLAPMLARARAAKNGKALTDAERQRVRDLAAKVQQLESQLEAQAAVIVAEQVETDATDAVKSIRRQQKRKPDGAYGSRNRIITTDKAAEIRARLAEKLSRMNVGIDPGVLIDAAQLGLYHLEAGARSFSAWSKAMLKELPDAKKLEPHLSEIFKQSSSLYGEALRTPAIEMLTAGEVAVLDNQPALDLLAESFVAAGVTDRVELERAMLDVLQEFEPRLTLRQVRDALSRYGQFKQLSDDEIKKRVRELRGEMQQASKLEDIAAKTVPLKTGQERRTPSAGERALIQQVNEELRKSGLSAEGDKAHVTLPLDMMKQRMRNRIEDLSRQITSRTRTLTTRTGVKLDKEAEALVKRRDALQKQFDDVFGRQEMTDEKRVQQAINSVNKSIKELRRRIAEKDVEPKKRESKTPQTPELIALKAERDALREELKLLQNALKPQLTPEQLAAKAWYTRKLNQLADLRDRVQRGDFVPRQRKPVELDRRMITLQAQVNIAKAEYDRGVDKWKRENATATEKAWWIAADMIGTLRLFVGGDVSFLLRQGRLILSGHPMMGVRAAQRTAASFLSKQWAQEVWAETQASPHHGSALGAGLEFMSLDPESVAPEKRPETMIAVWPRKIPVAGQVYAAGQRGFAAAHNYMIQSMWDLHAEQDAKANRTLTPKEARSRARWIMTLVGRPKLRGATANRAVTAAGAMLFAPRLYLSQLLSPLHMLRVASRNAETRRQALETGRMFGIFVGTGLLANLLWQAMNPDDEEATEWDLRSSDALKLRSGNTRFDIWAGYQQPMRTLAQLVTKERKDAAGRIHDADRSETLMRFFSSKRNPALSLLVDLMRGETEMGEPLFAPPEGKAGEVMTQMGLPPEAQGALGEAYRRFAFLWVQGAIEGAKESGLGAGIAAGLFEWAGGGSVSYPESAYIAREKLQDRLAVEQYGRPWLELAPREQWELAATNMETLMEADREVAVERSGRRSVTFDNTAALNAGRAVTKRLSPESRAMIQLATDTTGARLALQRKIHRYEMGKEVFERFQKELATTLDEQLQEVRSDSSWSTLTPVEQALHIQAAVKRSMAISFINIVEED